MDEVKDLINKRYKEIENTKDIILDSNLRQEIFANLRVELIQDEVFDSLKQYNKLLLITENFFVGSILVSFLDLYSL